MPLCSVAQGSLLYVLLMTGTPMAPLTCFMQGQTFIWSFSYVNGFLGFGLCFDEGD